jgi:spore maturation protein CgeB
LNILYLGRNSGTSGHRKEALVRLGHRVTHIDPEALLPSHRIISLWQWRAGSIGLAGIVRRRVLQSLDGEAGAPGSFDLAWIDHGGLVDATLVDELKARARHVLCYTIDDPFGGRDRLRWHQFFRALPHYDLLVVVRACNLLEAYDHGARKVLRVCMSADEIAHAPRALTEDERRLWQSEVAFVGTAFPERGPFLAELIKLGVPLALYGHRYDRLPQWPLLRRFWRPANTDSDDGYASAIGGAKICLGLLSKGNRDQHTTRSMEIPSLGGILCAERTPEHLTLYEEDREAVFWNTPQECASKCLALLADARRCEAIATAGRQRYLNNPWRNMAVLETVLMPYIADAVPPAPSGAPREVNPISRTADAQGTLTTRSRAALLTSYGNSPSTC